MTVSVPLLYEAPEGRTCRILQAVVSEILQESLTNLSQHRFLHKTNNRASKWVLHILHLGQLKPPLFAIRNDSKRQLRARVNGKIAPFHPICETQTQLCLSTGPGKRVWSHTIAQTGASRWERKNRWKCKKNGTGRKWYRRLHLRAVVPDTKIEASVSAMNHFAHTH